MIHLYKDKQTVATTNTTAQAICCHWKAESGQLCMKTIAQKFRVYSWTHRSLYQVELILTLYDILDKDNGACFLMTNPVVGPYSHVVLVWLLVAMSDHLTCSV